MTLGSEKSVPKASYVLGWTPNAATSVHYFCSFVRNHVCSLSQKTSASVPMLEVCVLPFRCPDFPKCLPTSARATSRLDAVTPHCETLSGSKMCLWYVSVLAACVQFLAP